MGTTKTCVEAVLFSKIFKNPLPKNGIQLNTLFSANWNWNKLFTSLFWNSIRLLISHGDAQLCDFIEGTYLIEQVQGEKEIGDLLTKMKRTGSTGLGVHILDKELQG